MGIELTCKQCGKIFEPTCHKSRQKYCSRECRVKCNNAKRYIPPENACVHCGAELDQSVNHGRHRRFCDETCRKTYFIEKLAQKKREAHNAPRICPNCGKEFRATWETGTVPRFCCDACRIEWWKEYHRTHSNEQDPYTSCAHCGKELEDRSRKYCSRACYRLSVAATRGTRLCQYCGKPLPKNAHSGRKYCCSACSSAARQLDNRADVLRRRCITTPNLRAWRRQLTKLANKAAIDVQKDRRILLVCGPASLVSTDALVNFITYQLQCDPFDGNVYVFCNSACTHLKWLEWDGSGFCVGARQTEWGKYPWPTDKTVVAIEITEREFLFLCSKSTDASRSQTP